MKPISKLLDKLADNRRRYENLKVFIGTKRGQSFVNNLYKDHLNNLYVRYQVPKNAQVKTLNQVLYVLCEIGLATKQYKFGGKYTYTITKSVPTTKPTKTTRLKIQSRLNKRQLYEIERRRFKRLGLAAKLHAYEEHKMKRFETKWKLPTEEQINQDIFSEELRCQTNTSKYIHREYVRNFISRLYSNLYTEKERNKYFGLYKTERYYRLFGLYQNTSSKERYYEKEMEPNTVGYPFIYRTAAPFQRLVERLRRVPESIKRHGGDLPLELRLYDKYGKFIASVGCE